MQELADGVAIHGSVAPSVLEEAARQYVSKLEAYGRKATLNFADKFVVLVKFGLVEGEQHPKLICNNSSSR